MPANENISNESLEQQDSNKPTLERSTSSQRRISGELQSDSLLLRGFINDNLEQNGDRKRDFRSLPRQEIHEKLFRDFFDIILQQAVFQVGTIYVNTKIYICCQI